jgi:uncharacterized protein (TIGR02996 family)
MSSLSTVLEEAILANPADQAAYMAYSDLLTEQGDPQGEFIQVQLRLEDESLSPAERKELQQREEALLEAHQEEWVGDWAQLAPNTGPEGRGQIDFPGPKPFRFIRGILAEATFDVLTDECARAFVAAPQTRMVMRLLVGGDAYADDGETLRTLLGWPHVENLRVFQFGWTSDEEYGDFCHFQCHLDGRDVLDLVKRMPQLEELYVFASDTPADRIAGLKTLDHLRVLQIYHTHLHSLSRLAENPTLSRLTHLLLHPKAAGAWSDDLPYLKAAELPALLRARHLKSLTHLRLRLTDIGDKGCQEIVSSGVLRRLKMLDLRHGCVSDQGARLLAGCPDLRNLELLDLSRNELTEAGIRALSVTGVSVRTEYQHGPTQDEDLQDREYLREGDYE